MQDNRHLLNVAILEYLQETLKHNNINDDKKPLEAAISSLRNAFHIPENNNNNSNNNNNNNNNNGEKASSILPLTLEAIFAVGYKQLNAAVSQISNTSNASNSNSAKENEKESGKNAVNNNNNNNKEEKFEAFLKDITEKGYFKDAAAGSAEYALRLEKAKQKFETKYGNSSQTANANANANAKPNAKPDAETIAKAESLKEQGNKKLSAKEYKEARDFYTQAIELIPSHIYYSNRAAAHQHLEDYQAAVDDCKTAIKIDPMYAKAFSRLGLAYYSLGQYDKAVIEGYDKALFLEPSNETAKEGKQRCLTGKSSATTATSSSPFGGFPGMPGMPGGAGGGGDFASMAAQMMQNPQMQQMAAQMMQNPQMMNMMQNMMGGGGAPGAGIPGGFGAAPSGSPNSNSNSNSNGIPPNLPNAREVADEVASDPMMAEFQNNPKMRSIMEEVQTQGPMAAMKYMGDPEVMAMIQKMMTNPSMQRAMSGMRPPQ